MKRFKVIFLYCFSICVIPAVFVLHAYGQTGGKIVGEIKTESGEALGGAVVRVVGTTMAVVTDPKGLYALPLDKGVYDIEYVHMSYRSKIERAVQVVDGRTQRIDMVLVERAKELDEVVVTALGISREEKALGYAATTLTGEELSEALTDNWTEALAGKVAGLNMAMTNAGPGSSNSIVLRGESNLTGSNEALIVVDGVVINNGSGRMSESDYSAAGDDESPIDYGSSINDLNPADIESVTVLKGPGAAALYGQRGANGAIIITTKEGQPRAKGFGLTVNSNSTFQFVNKGPDYQYEYGQGVTGSNYYSWGNSADGASTKATSSAWGPKFERQYFYQYDPVTQGQGEERTLWRPYRNSHRDFFDVGRTFNNTVTLEGGTRNTPIRFAYTNVVNKWIVPNTGANRNTLTFSASHRPTDKLQIATKIIYNHRHSDNLPASGYNNQTIMYWAAYWLPNADVSWLRNYWQIGEEGVMQNRPFASGPDNPYAIAYEMLNKLTRNAITGNVRVSYDFMKDLRLDLRTSIDYSNQATSQQRPFSTNKFRQGMYRTQDMFSQELSSDFMLNYKKDILGGDVKMNFSFGGSRLSNSYNKNEVRANFLIYPGIYSFANSRDNLLTYPYRSQYQINSLYGLATFSYKGFLYLDVTGRNDWNSVLATETSTDNVSFFYPSVNGSVILSEMLPMPDNINYMKFRGSFAQVGSGRTTPYQTSVNYAMVATFPGGVENQKVYNNTNLKPLFTTSYETGLDLRMFKNRIGLDLTLYHSVTKDQILRSVVDRSTGVDAILVNAGAVRNRGIEIEASSQILKNKKGLNWKVTGNFSANDNKVLSLTEGLSSMVLYNGVRGSVEAHLGERMDAIYGIGYVRSPDGQIVYENGYAKQTTETIYLGNTTPAWKAAHGHELKYKAFRLKMLFDGQYGGMAYSFTNAVNTELGKVKSTLPGRDNGIIGKGVILDSDGTYRPNDVVADNITTYYLNHAGRDNVEGNLFSTDFIKFREARFDYALPAKTVKKMGLQKASVGVYGRNLFIISTWPIYDPEFGTLTYGEINKGFETAQFPSSRVFGFNLVVGL